MVKNGIQNDGLRDELGTGVPLVCAERAPAMVRVLYIHREVPVEEEEDLHLLLSAAGLSCDTLG